MTVSSYRAGYLEVSGGGGYSPDAGNCYGI